MTDAITLDAYLRNYPVTMTTEHADSNPNMPDEPGRPPMDHWRVVLRHAGRQMTLIFSKGIGHRGARPEIREVLDCLASDAASVENAGDFEGWASDLGYEADSRKAERIYNTCKRQAASLKRLLGDAGFDALLWTDRE